MSNHIRPNPATDQGMSRISGTEAAIAGSRAKTVFTGLTQGGFSGPGKVWAEDFYPAFCKALHAAGIETCFVRTAEALESVIDHARTIIIHVYNEERNNDSVLRVDAKNLGVVGVWNSPENIDLIADKRSTNVFLRQLGIRVPEIEHNQQSDRPIFSNACRRSNATAYVTDRGNLDPQRYNTGFVDTRHTYNGKSYYSSVRLMCVGAELVTAYVRLRDETEGSPSVHNRNTPLEPSLITHFQKLLVEDRLAELKVLANRIGDAFGPGFYSHDLVTEAATGDIYVCEVGLKLSDETYSKHLLTLKDRLPGMERCFSPVYPQEAAGAFIKECARHGWL